MLSSSPRTLCRLDNCRLHVEGFVAGLVSQSLHLRFCLVQVLGLHYYESLLGLFSIHRINWPDSREITEFREPIGVWPTYSACYWGSCGIPYGRSRGYLWLSYVLVGPFSSCWVVLPSLDMMVIHLMWRLYTWFYCSLLCQVWLMSLGGLLLSRRWGVDDSGGLQLECNIWE